MKLVPIIYIAYNSFNSKVLGKILFKYNYGFDFKIIKYYH